MRGSQEQAENRRCEDKELRSVECGGSVSHGVHFFVRASWFDILRFFRCAEVDNP